MLDKDLSTQQAVQYLQQGKIIAYPTEAVYGLGCDPMNHSALLDLMLLKNRANNKGVILIASNLEQLAFYVDISVYPSSKTGSSFTTWLLPINVKNKDKIDPVIYGQHETIAIRVSKHPVVVELCNLFSRPIVSTSANISGQEAIKDKLSLYQLVNDNPLIFGVVAGDLGGFDRPSAIINPLTGDVIR